MIKWHTYKFDVRLSLSAQDLSTISHFNDRLECFMFQSRFSDALSDIEHRINNINHVCEQLAASVAMRQV